MGCFGGGGKVAVPPEPAPAPQPIAGREEEESKKKAGKNRRSGRESNMLAGRLNAQRGSSILNTKLG